MIFAKGVHYGQSRWLYSLFHKGNSEKAFCCVLANFVERNGPLKGAANHIYRYVQMY